MTEIPIPARWAIGAAMALGAIIPTVRSLEQRLDRIERLSEWNSHTLWAMTHDDVTGPSPPPFLALPYVARSDSTDAADELILDGILRLLP